MDDIQIHRDMLQGQRAKELWENATLQEAFTEIEKEIFGIWQDTKTNQSEQREQAWLTQRAMTLLKSKLQNWMNSGKIAAAEQAKKEHQAESLKASR